MPLVKSVKRGGFKVYRATPRAMHVQLALVTQLKVLRHAMLSLLVRTVGMALIENVIWVIFVKVTPPIKPLANRDPTPPTKDPLDALNVHPVRMPTRLVPYLVKIVTLIPTNPNPMLQNAFQCKKVFTNRAPQHK
jgi:hypothetical protein